MTSEKRDSSFSCPCNLHSHHNQTTDVETSIGFWRRASHLKQLSVWTYPYPVFKIKITTLPFGNMIGPLLSWLLTHSISSYTNPVLFFAVALISDWLYLQYWLLFHLELCSCLDLTSVVPLHLAIRLFSPHVHKSRIVAFFVTITVVIFTVIFITKSRMLLLLQLLD